MDWPVCVSEVIYYSWGTGQRIEHFSLWLGANPLQHVDKMVVEAGEWSALLYRDVHPVPYTLQRSILIASEHGRVSKQPPGSHHT